MPGDDLDEDDSLSSPSEPAPIEATGFTTLGSPGLIGRTMTSTPLEADEPEGTIPRAALWAMKYRRHLRLAFGRRDEDERVRTMIGAGDAAVYLIDDGPRHFMIGRMVGEDGEGLLYCLVGRVDSASVNTFGDVRPRPEEAFSKARDMALCSVFAAPGGVSNVMVVETYRHLEDVPPDYLPPGPFLEFE
jgi:hypothetical protein